MSIQFRFESDGVTKRLYSTVNVVNVKTFKNAICNCINYAYMSHNQLKFHGGLQVDGMQQITAQMYGKTGRAKFHSSGILIGPDRDAITCWARQALELLPKSSHAVELRNSPALDHITLSLRMQQWFHNTRLPAFGRTRSERVTFQTTRTTKARKSTNDRQRVYAMMEEDDRTTLDKTIDSIGMGM